jgi:hypothetical protein
MKKLLVLFVAVLSVSCSGFLEPQSQSEYIPKEAASLNEMLLGNAYPGPAGSAVISILSHLDDDVKCSVLSDAEVNMEDESAADQAEYSKAFFTWQPNCYVVAEDLGGTASNYEIYYDYIMGCNAALDYVDDVTGFMEEINEVKTQAYTLRAFYYFLLVNTYGTPYNVNKAADGVPLRLSSGLGTTELPRNTVEEVYSRILTDLLEVERLYLTLPVEYQFRRNGRTSLPMVQLLLSRVYLYMENWGEAAKYAQKVIDNPNFSLVDLNTASQRYYNYASQDCPETIWTFGSTTTWVSQLMPSNLKLQRQVQYDEWTLITYSLNFFAASDELVNLFDADDLRKQKYLVEEVYLDGYYGGEVLTGVYWPNSKFDIYMNTTWQGSTPTYTSNTFAHALRLSEAYLNLAEASVQNNGDNVTALKALNDLRKNRFSNHAPLTGLTGADLLSKIREERRRELCFEGHRWFDLRRYGMPSITHEWHLDGETYRYVLQEKDPGYTLPIPQYVMDVNRSLNQNPLAHSRDGVLTYLPRR